MSSNEKHEHDYVSEKIIKQILDSIYLSDGKYQTATLERQSLIIFCRTCGDSKYINEQSNDKDA